MMRKHCCDVLMGFDCIKSNSIGDQLFERAIQCQYKQTRSTCLPYDRLLKAQAIERLTL